MKAKVNAKQKREAEAQARKTRWSEKENRPAGNSSVPAAPVSAPKVKEKEPVPQLSPEEEARIFLEYLEKHDQVIRKDDSPQARKKEAPGRMAFLNLEEGMPLAEEAVRRLHMGIQEMRAGRVKVVKLIHGYGSTGRGGKICIAVREELAAMKRKKLVREYIPGEDFGPVDAASRRLAETDRNIPKDPDYGRMNHGITVVIL